MNASKAVRLCEIFEVWESLNGWYWFVTEYHEETFAFGLMKGWETEWGEFDLKELRRLARRLKVWKVQKRNWAFCPCVVDDAASFSWLEVGEESLPAMKGTVPRRVAQTQGAAKSAVKSDAGLRSLKNLKGGGQNMAFENKNQQSAVTAVKVQEATALDKEETATLCPTKAGNGFKVVVDGIWYYASKAQVLQVIEGIQRACTFHTIKDEEQ